MPPWRTLYPSSGAEPLESAQERSVGRADVARRGVPLGSHRAIAIASARYAAPLGKDVGRPDALARQRGTVDGAGTDRGTTAQPTAAAIGHPLRRAQPAMAERRAGDADVRRFAVVRLRIRTRAVSAADRSARGEAVRR